MDEKQLNLMIKKLESWTNPHGECWDWHDVTAARIIERMCKLRGLVEQMIAMAVDTATDWGSKGLALKRKEVSENG